MGKTLRYKDDSYEYNRRGKKNLKKEKNHKAERKKLKEQFRDFK